MRKPIRFALILFILSCCILSHENARAQEEILWIKFKAYPTYIHDGSFKGKGMGDLTLELLIDRLPEYKHTILWMNNMRLNYSLKDKSKNYCSFYLFKTKERQKHAYFSITSGIVPPTSIIFPKDKAALFGTGILSLNKLLQNRNLQLGIIGGRAYGVKVNEILDKYKDAPNIEEVIVDNISETAMRMLCNKRFDYTIDFPQTHVYLSKLDKEFEKLDIASIKENPALVKVHIGLSQTETNRILAEKTNRILREIRTTDEFFNATWGLS